MQLLILFVLPFVVSGYETGAPLVTCKDMTPKHQTPAQTTPSPYKVLVSESKAAVNKPIVITLTSKSGQDEFKGFLVQVKRADADGANSGPAGGFVDEGSPDSPSDARVLPCAGGETLNGAMTHTNGKSKKVVHVKWMASMPGKYKIYTTFVKDYSTYWVNQVHEQVIEVEPGTSAGPHHQNHHHIHHEPTYDWPELCETLALNKSIKPEEESESPYLVKLEPLSGDGTDNQKVSQGELMWINVTSDLGTQIDRMFLQVRRKGSKERAAFGKFILEDPKYFTLVDCFGGKGNAILFSNPEHETNKIYDIEVQWTAPLEEVGDFEVVGSILKEEYFWDNLSPDRDSRRITVLKKSSKPNTNPEGGSQLSSGTGGVGLTVHLLLFVLFSRL